MEPDGPEGQADVRAPVAALVSLVSHTVQDTDGQLSPAETAVILDLEVRDVRCVLSRAPQPTASAGSPLSKRQLEIATVIACGSTNEQIASTLQINKLTVSTQYTSHLREARGLNPNSDGGTPARNARY
jgi:DNA-binding NarL/FixJ family response regulator